MPEVKPVTPPHDERDTLLNNPEGQLLLGARDLIAEEAFRVVTDPCDISDLGRPVFLDPGSLVIGGLSPGSLVIGGALPVGGFSIHHPAGDVIFTLHFDGRVEINPAYAVEEAARAFWDAVIRLNPYGDRG
jgi:hypothetical protein